jgi:hypothetical protein
MARHWFYSFGTNPSAESFVRSRACFELIFPSLLELSVVSWLVLQVSCGSGIGSLEL